MSHNLKVEYFPPTEQSARSSDHQILLLFVFFTKQKNYVNSNCFHDDCRHCCLHTSDVCLHFPLMILRCCLLMLHSRSMHQHSCVSYTQLHLSVLLCSFSPEDLRWLLLQLAAYHILNTCVWVVCVIL